MVLKKYEIEAALHAENQEISAGRLKEDNPLDQSEGFTVLCEACRRGDLKVCQEKIQEGVNINARDKFDYTPLILASLCGHFEVVQLLLESGALCERDTFQGERCLYNALNDRIRTLLLSYDYSKSSDPLQPLAAHISSLLIRDVPNTSDITIGTSSTSFRLHKFLLSARSPYFARKLSVSPDTTYLRVPHSIPDRALEIAIQGLYFGEINVDLSASEEDQLVLAGVAKLGRQMEISHIFEDILTTDRRLARQRRTEEVERGRIQLDEWFHQYVLEHAMQVESDKVPNVKWDLKNNLFADVLLCATDQGSEQADIFGVHGKTPKVDDDAKLAEGIPIGPSNEIKYSNIAKRQSTLFPAHRAMLLRAEYFAVMFSSSFKEAQPGPYLPIVHVDCSPAVLTKILTYLYTEYATFDLDLALEVLFAADNLFIERLKLKAVQTISTLGNGAASIVEADNSRGATNVDEAIDPYDVIRAGWVTRMPRLEEFGARYIAYRLERYIDEEEFKELVKESASRIQKRQETDTVELIDDIRYYLSERFRLRFEDAGIDDMLDENETESINLAKENALLTPSVNADDTKYDEARLAPKQETQAEITVPVHDASVIRNLAGEEVDEFTQDALQYQDLLGKIDRLLETLKLDA